MMTVIRIPLEAVAGLMACQRREVDAMTSLGTAISLGGDASAQGSAVARVGGVMEPGVTGVVRADAESMANCQAVARIPGGAQTAPAAASRITGDATANAHSTIRADGTSEASPDPLLAVRHVAPQPKTIINNGREITGGGWEVING